MKYRKKMNGRKSRKLFTKTAKRINRKNGMGLNPMRGGIRL